jgi:hypothetical protein
MECDEHGSSPRIPTKLWCLRWRGRSEGIPPVGRGTFKPSRNVQDLFPVIALGNVQLLPDDLKPIIDIQGINQMRESRRVVAHEIILLVSSLGCIMLLVLLILLILLNMLH